MTMETQDKRLNYVEEQLMKQKQILGAQPLGRAFQQSEKGPHRISELEILESSIAKLTKAVEQHGCAIEPILFGPNVAKEKYGPGDQPALSPLFERIRDCRVAVDKLTENVEDLTKRILF